MSKVSNLKKYVVEFGENIFSSDDEILFCKLYETNINGIKD